MKKKKNQITAYMDFKHDFINMRPMAKAIIYNKIETDFELPKKVLQVSSSVDFLDRNQYFVD